MTKNGNGNGETPLEKAQREYEEGVAADKKAQQESQERRSGSGEGDTDGR